MADSRELGRPGTFTALLEEVVRGTPRADGAAGLKPGAVIGRYELVREVGRGGSGIVYEARDRELGRSVAFKVLRASGEETRERRLLAEAEVAARLSHPNIVTVLDVGRSEHGPYLVQEFLTGATLAGRLAAGPLEIRESVRIARELARGLAHAHANGVVHRDLSPRNVQLCEDGQVKLLDLGMAAAFGRRKVEGGTPAYMAPEQARGAPEDERTDVWALGALLYRMLTGRDAVEVGGSGLPRSNPLGLSVPAAPELGELVESMLAVEPTARPRDAAAVLEQLDHVEGVLRASSSPTAGRVRVRPPGRTRWLALGAVAGAAIIVLVAIPFVLWRGGSARSGLAAVLSGNSGSRPCTWAAATFPTRHDFDGVPAGARFRNGDFVGQRLTRREGRGAWSQESDWNQLWLPMAKPLPDVFSIEASFLAPVKPEGTPQVSLHVFSDPLGPMDHTSSLARGGRILELVHEHGRAPTYDWWKRDETGAQKLILQGTLAASFEGAWHVLRIEGSRSEGWLRASLDGSPLALEVGAFDLTGEHIVLGGNGPAYTQADVLWRAVEIREGTGDCR